MEAPLIPNLKVGENEKLSSHAALNFIRVATIEIDLAERYTW